MECIYCGHTTSVTNSRSTDKKRMVWRRRHCSACGAIFTTHEQSDLSTSFMVQKKAAMQPFSRDTLYISIYEACRHRKLPTLDAQQLTKTIITKLLINRSYQDSVIPIADIRETAFTTLQSFDVAASTYYQAYYIKQR